MPEKDTLHIKSLTLSADAENRIFSLSCHLSNGMKSPIYSSLMNKTEAEAVKMQTIELPDDKAIESVHINDSSQTILSVAFLGEDGTLLGSFNPRASDQACDNEYTAKKLDLNQSVVGIYGVKDDKSYLTSLGFILKQKA